jgi:hypothetical protein
MARCVHLTMVGATGSRFSVSGQGIKKMRFSLAVAVVMVGISVSGLAQQSDAAFKVKSLPPEKKAKPLAIPTGKAAASATNSGGANARDLQTIENQTKKTATMKAPGTRTPGKAAALKPVKDKPNPPMNFNGTSGSKTSMTNQSANPYKGRLRQKHTHQ